MTTKNQKPIRMLYEYQGEKKTLQDWGTELGIKWKTLWARLNKGIHQEIAFQKNLEKKKPDRDKTKTITKVCEWCGKDFVIPKCRDWREHSCSTECKGKVREAGLQSRLENRKRQCKNCGKDFTPRHSQIVNGAGKYCSNKCCTIGNTGLTRTEETKLKMSEAMKNSPNINVMRGPDNPSWKGGSYIVDGYKWLNIDGKKISEHRHVVESAIGRTLSSDEIVHHINHDRLDNRIENLIVLSRSEHINEHRDDLIKALRAG